MRPSRYHTAFHLIAAFDPDKEPRKLKVDFSDEMAGLDSVERQFGLVFAPFRRNLYNLGRLAVHRLIETYKWTTIMTAEEPQFMLNRSFDAVDAESSNEEYADLVTRFAPESDWVEQKAQERRQELRQLYHLHKRISGTIKDALPWITDAMHRLAVGQPLPSKTPDVDVDVTIGKLGGPEGTRGDYTREEWQRFYRRGPSPDELEPMKLPSPYGLTASAIDSWVEELQKFSIAQWAREKEPETLNTVISNLMTAIDAVSKESAVLNSKADFARQRWNEQEKQKRMEQIQEERRQEEQQRQEQQPALATGG